MAIEKTYSMLKPDAVRNRHMGEIIARIERSGLTIERMELGMVTPEQAAANYAEHEGKPFYNGLIEYKSLFKLFSAITGGKDKIASSGTFTLNSDMDYRALISGISANSASRAVVDVTIPEGYTVAQIFQLLEEKGVATVEDLNETETA